VQGILENGQAIGSQLELDGSSLPNMPMLITFHLLPVGKSFRRCWSILKFAASRRPLGPIARCELKLFLTATRERLEVPDHRARWLATVLLGAYNSASQILKQKIFV